MTDATDATATTVARWKRRPDGSNWGEFGADDQLGRLNWVGPEQVRRGAAEVREGLAFCLSLPLDLPGGNVLNPRRHPPVLRPTVRGAAANLNYVLARDDPNATDVISDDLAILHLQYSTQWDSLAHVGQLFDADGDGVAEPVYYNGWRAGADVVGPQDARDAGVPGWTAPLGAAGESAAAGGADAVGAQARQADGPYLGARLAAPRSTSAARALGIENMAVHGLQGRGVMIDLHAHLGEARTRVGYDALMRVLEADRVEIERGDLVCLHTGFAQLLMEMGGRPDAHRLEQACAALDGRDARLLRWIDDSGLAALAADNYAVEAYPAAPQPGCCATLPLHAHCLFGLGVNLGELWLLTPLARWLRAHGRSRFLLTAPPLRLPGAVGSPVTPVATV